MEDFDVYEQLVLLEKAIDGVGSYSRMDSRQRFDVISRLSLLIRDAFKSYLSGSKSFVHKRKRDLLKSMIKELDRLRSFARSSDGFDGVVSSFKSFKELVDVYSSLGVVYLFRHCDKAKRVRSDGSEYVGIPSDAVRDQAFRVAKMIVDEIRVSPKKVYLEVVYSEVDRTRIFGDIVMSVLESYNHLISSKVKMHDRGFDRSIRFGFWDNASMNELVPYLKEREKELGDSALFTVFFDWYYQRGALKKMVHQPDPGEVRESVSSFLKRSYGSVNRSDDYYHLVIAFTHSWVIDAFLLDKFKSWYRREKSLIATASYCKVECGDVGYEGSWRKFSS